MRRNFMHRWRIQSLIDGAARPLQPSPSDDPGRGESDAQYHSRLHTIERRLRREATLAARAPSASLRGRTLNAIYDLEFHRRYRRLPWWRTSHGGSALVAASVMIAGILFAVMTLPRTPLPAERPIASLPPAAPLVAASAAAAAPESPEPFEFTAESFEITALAAPEWVIQVFAPESIRDELNAIADEALRAADYFVSRFAAARAEAAVPTRPAGR